MDTILTVLKLLTKAFEALKAYLEFSESRNGGDIHPKAHRPKHLKA